jgi:hypothetical protein
MFIFSRALVAITVAWVIGIEVCYRANNLHRFFLSLREVLAVFVQAQRFSEG